MPRPVPGADVFSLAPPPLISPPESASYVGMLNRPLLTPPHVAFVKIAEGCSRACTYCIIHVARGPQHSRPADEILTQVRTLLAKGYRVVAADINHEQARQRRLSHS